jgi:hypothetical protein
VKNTARGGAKIRTARKKRVHDVFAGGGEMGALMRSIDWSKTAVGPVDKWPQSLKTALSILLAQRTAVFIF